MKRKHIGTLFASIVSLLTALSFVLTLYFYNENKKKIEEIPKLETKVNEADAIINSNRYFSDGFNEATNGHLDLAIDSYKKAIEIYPNNSDALHFLGYAEYAKWFKSKKDPSLLGLAQKDLEKSLSLNPGNTWAHYNYSIVCWWAKDRPKAIQQIRILLGLDPSFKEKIRHDGQFKPFKESEEFMNLIWK